jgi:hypothetical protein
MVIGVTNDRRQHLRDYVRLIQVLVERPSVAVV